MTLQPSVSRTIISYTTGVFGVCAAVAMTSKAVAMETIGSATKISQSVTGAVGGRAFPVSAGDDVKLRETVHTDAQGEARLTFRDDTLVSVFSSSTITLQQFGPNGKIMWTSDGTYTVRTGHSTPGALRVETSAGTLIPHGTFFSFVVHGDHLNLEVAEGEVTFCPRGLGAANCVEARPGQSVTGGAGMPPRGEGGSSHRPPGGPPPPPPSSTPYPTPINYGYPPNWGGHRVYYPAGSPTQQTYWPGPRRINNEGGNYNDGSRYPYPKGSDANPYWPRTPYPHPGGPPSYTRAPGYGYPSTANAQEGGRYRYPFGPNRVGRPSYGIPRYFGGTRYNSYKARPFTNSGIN
jgi:hypothetical protein